MGGNPSRFKGANRPVERVSWFDAVHFANKLSELEGLESCYTISRINLDWSNRSCRGWRLPTEAEWEYAARGSESYKYAGSSSVDSVAWYSHNSGSETHNVCTKQKNGYGLCDMSGNVDEWVWDLYDTSLYGSHADHDMIRYPRRVRRGGSWRSIAWSARVSFRYYSSPDKVLDDLGFRLGRTP